MLIGSRPSLFTAQRVKLAGESHSAEILQTKERMVEIDGLRGIAIWTVIAGHYFILEYSDALKGFSPLVWTICSKFNWGVDLFFVISGFLIGGILIDHRNSGTLLKAFYLRRAFRIWPLYFFLVLLILGPTYFLGFPGQRHYTSYWSYLTFSQNFWMAAGFWSLSAFRPLWSIAIEEQFYAVAPFAVRNRSLATIKGLLWSVIALALLTRLFCLLFAPKIDPNFLTFCRLDTIAIGFLAALYSREENFLTRLRPATIVLLGVAVATLVCLPLAGTLISVIAPACFALFCAMALLFVTNRRDSTASWVVRCPLLTVPGKYCYFLYLFHFIILDNVAMIIHQPLLVRFFSLGIALFAAAISWTFFESPCIRLGHRWRYRGDDSRHGSKFLTGPFSANSGTAPAPSLTAS